MNQFLSCLLLLSFMSCSPKAQQIQLDQFNVRVPVEFRQLEINSEKDELLKLNYQNELYIIVQDNIGDIIEGYKSGIIDPMEYIQKLKFTALKSAYNGTNPGEVVSSQVNGHPFLSQEFYSKVAERNIYYEYRIMKVGENYFEFIVSGKAESKEKHLQLINDFYTSISI